MSVPSRGKKKTKPQNPTILASVFKITTFQCNTQTFNSKICPLQKNKLQGALGYI